MAIRGHRLQRQLAALVSLTVASAASLVAAPGGIAGRERVRDYDASSLRVAAAEPSAEAARVARRAASAYLKTRGMLYRPHRFVATCSEIVSKRGAWRCGVRTLDRRCRGSVSLRERLSGTFFVGRVTLRCSQVRVWAVGDGAGTNLEDRTSVPSFVTRRPRDLFFYLGDVYESGTAAEMRMYDAAWGSLAATTLPILQNHEYRKANAQPWFDYWNAKRPGLVGTVGGAREGYYSFVTANGWQIIALNTEWVTSGQAPNPVKQAAQLAWLDARLAARAGRKRIVLMGRPRYTAGNDHRDDPALHPFWMRFAGKVALVLSGDNHTYQRLHPIDRVVQMIAGTGGRNHKTVNARDPRLAAYNQTDFGALRITLRERSITTAFIRMTGRNAGTVQDLFKLSLKTNTTAATDGIAWKNGVTRTRERVLSLQLSSARFAPSRGEQKTRKPASAGTFLMGPPGFEPGTDGL